MLHHRLPQFSRLSQDWASRTVFLLGGGPSLSGFDFLALQGRGVVVAINDALLAAPWANCAFTIDMVWLGQRRVAIVEFVARGGEMVAAVPDRYCDGQPGVTYVERVPGVWLSENGAQIYTGDNSGFAALGMAIMRGAARIALLGYDMTGPGHFHGGYPWPCRFGAANYSRWARSFQVLAVQARNRGIHVINCNPNSAVDCFPVGRWEDVAE